MSRREGHLCTPPHLLSWKGPLGHVQGHYQVAAMQMRCMGTLSAQSKDTPNPKMQKQPMSQPYDDS